jgi:hypothetical protein
VNKISLRIWDSDAKKPREIYCCSLAGPDQSVKRSSVANFFEVTKKTLGDYDSFDPKQKYRDLLQDMENNPFPEEKYTLELEIDDQGVRFEDGQEVVAPAKKKKWTETWLIVLQCSKPGDICTELAERSVTPGDDLYKGELKLLPFAQIAARVCSSNEEHDGPVQGSCHVRSIVYNLSLLIAVFT